MRRGLVTMVVAFAVVLAGGVAFAAVGIFGGDSSPAGPPALASDDAASADLRTGIDDEVDTETAETDEVKPDVATLEDSSRDGKAAVEEADETADTSLDENASDAPDDGTGDDETGDDETGDDATRTVEIAVTSPAPEAHVDDAVITFRGEATPGAKVRWSTYEADMSDDGHWAIALKLTPGKNVMVFVAETPAGARAEAAVTVYYDFEEPTETVPGFTAHQKWEVVDGVPAKNIYWGTATPGSTVSVASDFGNKSVTASKGGGWEMDVAFDAPCDEWFAVSVASDGVKKTFEMKRACADATHEFSANQKWEVVDGTPVTNIYWGTAEPGALVSVGSDHGSSSTTAGPEGGWELQVTFDAPCNEWFVVAAESGENRATFEMKRACAEEQTVDFTAKQQYGECAEELPYDVFWGTAPVGATVTVQSPYGSGQTTANGEGHWEIRVEFPDAPIGTEFEVVVSSTAGGSKVFGFLATG